MRVTTVDKHDIYHISDVDMSSEASPRPLMTITTTMKEVILFAPFVGSTRRKVKNLASAWVHDGVGLRPNTCPHGFLFGEMMDFNAVVKHTEHG